MKKALLILLLAIAGIGVTAQTVQKSFLDQPYIEVTGTAELEVVPDMIYLAIVLNESDTKGRISLEMLESRMKERLTALGINVSGDLTVEDLSSSYMQYFLKDKVAGSKHFRLLVHDAATAGKVIKALSEEEISNISITKIDHSQMAQKRFDLRLEAVKAAKRKAEAMAECIGQQIGKAIYITENTAADAFVQSAVNSVLLESRVRSDQNQPEPAFKNITIKSGVSVTFILY